MGYFPPIRIYDTWAEVQVLTPSRDIIMCRESGHRQPYMWASGQLVAFDLLQSGDVGTGAGKIPTIPVPMSSLSVPVKVAIDAITATGPDSAAYHPASDFATPAQLGLKANTSSLAPVATTGTYADLSGKPTLGTASAQNTSAFATAAQGVKADSALQAEADPVALAALATHVNSITAHGRMGSALGANVTVASVEKSIISLVIPANSLRVGSSFHFRAYGNFGMTLNLTSTSRSVIRVGATTLAGLMAASVTVNNTKGLSGTAPLMIEGDCIVRSVGVVGAMIGRLCMWGALIAPFNDDISAPTTATINTTINNVLELTYLTTNAAASTVFDVAFIEGG